MARDADLAAETEGLNARIGLPRSLRAMGVPESVIPEMADKAEKESLNSHQPAPVFGGRLRGLDVGEHCSITTLETGP